MNIDAIMPVLVNRIGWTLVHSMWEGVVIAAALALLLRAMRGAPANARYLACCVAMLMMIIALAATFCIVRTAPAIEPVRITSTPAPMVAVPIPSAAPLASSRQLTTTDEPSVLRSIVIAWTIGVILMALRHLGGWFVLLKMRTGNEARRYAPAIERLSRRLGIAQIIRIVETSRIDVPAVIGALRPVLLVPVGIANDLTAQQVEAILAHELAHIRRHDYLINLLQSAVESLMFYHPATWWMSGRIRAERENCCDDIAAEICGKAVYAAALARLEAHRRSWAPSLAPAATGGELLARIRRLLRLPPLRTLSPVRSIAVATMLLTCLALPVLVLAQKQRSATSAKSPPTTQQATVSSGFFLRDNEPTYFTLPTTRPAVKRPFELPTFQTFTISPTIAGSGLRFTDGHNTLTAGTLTFTPSREMLMVANRAILSAATQPATRPADPYEYVSVIVGKTALLHNDKPTTIDELDALLAAMPIEQRRKTVLAVAAGSPNVTVERFFRATADLHRLVEKHKLAYLSETGIKPTTEPAATPGAAGMDYHKLLEYRAAVLKQMLELSQRLGANHPALVRARQELEAIDEYLAEIHTAEQIAAVDPKMRELLKSKEELELRLVKLRRNLGDNNRGVLDAKTDLQLLNEQIEAYAAKYRANFAATKP